MCDLPEPLHPHKALQSQRTGRLITHLSAGKAKLWEMLPESRQHGAIGSPQPCPRVTEQLSVPHTPTPPRGTLTAQGGTSELFPNLGDSVTVSAAARHTVVLAGRRERISLRKGIPAESERSRERNKRVPEPSQSRSSEQQPAQGATRDSRPAALVPLLPAGRRL